MPNLALTEKSISRIRTGAESTYWDLALPGFGIKVYPSGRKTFVVKFRSQGRQVYKHLAGAHLVTVAEAREQARAILRDEFLSASPEPFPSTSMEEFALVYIERHAKLRKKSWKTDEQRLRDWIKPALGKLALKDIRRHHIAKLHEDIGRQFPTLANRLREVLSVMFKCARVWGYLPEGHHNPAADIEDFPERSSERWLTREELLTLAGVLRFYRNRYLVAAIYFSIFTGKRKMEVLSLQWSQVDLEGKMARIGMTKNGQPAYVPLCEPLVDILKSLRRQQDNPFVFCGRLPGKPLLNVDKLWNTVRKRAGLEDVRFHDLRHTAASHLIQSGASLEVVGELLNHKSKDATRRYAHLAFQNLQDASAVLGDRLSGMMKKR